MAAWRFLKKAAALSAPFWIYAGLIAICDPFDFWARRRRFRTK